jgi:invasion protein IalB
MKLARVVLLFAALSGTAQAQGAPPSTGSSPAPAAQVPSSQIVISGWRYECDSSSGTFACHVSDVVTVRGGDTVVAALRIQLAGEPKSPVIAVQVPLGIAVAHGVRIWFENGALQTVPIFTCDRRGCFATAQLGGPMLAAMRSAKQRLRIAYEALNGTAEQTISIQLGLDDFSAAYDQLRR